MKRLQEIENEIQEIDAKISNLNLKMSETKLVYLNKITEFVKSYIDKKYWKIIDMTVGYDSISFFFLPETVYSKVYWSGMSKITVGLSMDYRLDRSKKDYPENDQIEFTAFDVKASTKEQLWIAEDVLELIKELYQARTNIINCYVNNIREAKLANETDENEVICLGNDRTKLKQEKRQIFTQQIKDAMKANKLFKLNPAEGEQRRLAFTAYKVVDDSFYAHDIEGRSTVDIRCVGRNRVLFRMDKEDFVKQMGWRLEVGKVRL